MNFVKFLNKYQNADKTKAIRYLIFKQILFISTTAWQPHSG